MIDGQAAQPTICGQDESVILELTGKTAQETLSPMLDQNSGDDSMTYVFHQELTYLTLPLHLPAFMHQPHPSCRSACNHRRPGHDIGKRNQVYRPSTNGTRQRDPVAAGSSGRGHNCSPDLADPFDTRLVRVIRIHESGINV